MKFNEGEKRNVTMRFWGILKRTKRSERRLTKKGGRVVRDDVPPEPWKKSRLASKKIRGGVANQHKPVTRERAVTSKSQTMG